MARLFERRRKDGHVVVTLPEDAVTLLKQVISEVAQVVAAPPDGELRDRLYPSRAARATAAASDAADMPDPLTRTHDDTLLAEPAAGGVE